MNWRIGRWLVAILLVAAGILVWGLVVRQPAPPRNILLLTIDTWRPDHLGCAGYHRDTTPFLDRLANKGTLFTNMISSAPWTCPSLISIFTGQYPMLHGVNARGHSLRPQTETLFDVFGQNGYQVPDIAYLSNIPNFMNLGLEAKAPLSKQKGRQPGDELIDWLADHKARPFVAWYHYRFLHLPYNPKEKYNIFVDEEGRRLMQDPFFKEWLNDEVVIPWGKLTFSPAQQTLFRDLYDGQLRELDAFIQRLHETIQAMGLIDNTLWVITADHGEELFEHGFVGHASTTKHAKMYDEVIKIPLILYGPGYIEQGRLISEQVRQIDIMPTLIDLMRLSAVAGVQGESLLPLMKGDRRKTVPPALIESIMAGYQSDPMQETRFIYALRTPEWKLVRLAETGDSRYQLFDLKTDPRETRNVALQNPAIRDRLSRELEQALAGMQVKRLTLLASQTTTFSSSDIPAGAKLTRPVITTPDNNAVIQIQPALPIVLQWTGDPEYTYVIEYDAGIGWRNLKGRLPVQGNRKTFGPLPAEAYDPLPYWNPYRIRVSPYGHEDYWSEWVEFSFKAAPAEAD